MTKPTDIYPPPENPYNIQATKQLRYCLSDPGNLLLAQVPPQSGSGRSGNRLEVLLHGCRGKHSPLKGQFGAQ